MGRESFGFGRGMKGNERVCRSRGLERRIGIKS